MTTITVSTAVPSVTFSTTGLDVPDEADILAGRLTDLSTAIGGSLSQSLTTPQGQIASTETAIIADKNDQLLAISNQINPDYATGRWQDAIGRIYFMTRIAASGTVVTATCTGLVETVIPAGSIAQDAAGYLYYSLADATIGSSGSVSIEFQNQTTGPIACAIGTLTVIYKSVTGWSGITNPTAGVLGTDIEGRANFEYRRQQSVGANSSNTLGKMIAAILAVPDVVDAYVIDNKTGAAVATGSSSYSIPAHSYYIAVYGGATADIGTAIHNAAAPGVNFTGSSTYTVQDNVNYVYPYPTYTYNWVTPTAISVYVNVQLKSSTLLPSDISLQVQTAVISAFNGSDGGTRARIGSTIFAGRYYSGIYNIDQENVDILSVTLSRDNTTFSNSISFGIDEIPTLDATNIVVTLV